MAKEAIREDVSEQEETAQNPEEDPRLQMMEGIAERARKEREEEFGYTKEDEEPDDEPEDDDQEDSDEDEPEEEPQEESKEQFVKIVVDGEEQIGRAHV